MRALRGLLLAILSAGSVAALGLGDVTPDTPVAQIVAAAVNHLTAGKPSDALALFSVAISRHPDDYSTLFKRASTYLSLGRLPQALDDFDRVLKLRPDFDPALLNRAKIKFQNGDWDGAERDYSSVKKQDGSLDILTLRAVKEAAVQSEKDEKKGSWDACVDSSSTVLKHATRAHSVRQRRIRCQLEQGDYAGAASDLEFLSSRASQPDLGLHFSPLLFFGLGERSDGLVAIRNTLQSDPDSKQAMRIFKLEKAIARDLGKVEQYKAEKKFTLAAKSLTGTSDASNVIVQAQNAIKELISLGLLPSNSASKSRLLFDLNALACELYVEAKSHKKAQPYCEKVRLTSPANLHAAINKASLLLAAKQYEDAVRALEIDGIDRRDPRVASLLNTAKQQLHVSKQKDYYKVLGVERDASEKQIKKAFRRRSLEVHPDRVPQDQRAEAEKKMAALNEAYGVLSDPQLKAQYDSGHDPNDPTAGFHGNQPHTDPFNAHAQFQHFFQGPSGQQFRFFTNGGGHQAKGGRPEFHFAGNDFRFG